MSEHPIRLVVSDDLERDRLTAFFRWLLAIPHLIWIALWSIAALLAAIVNWAATLILARSPGWLHRFLAAYVKYATQLYAYLYLAANPYPTFDGQDGYPVDLSIAPPARQSRWTVALRGLLLLPAALIVTALTGAPGGTTSFRRQGSFSLNFGLLYVAAVLAWFAIMARGRMPRGLRDAAAYALSYGAQFWGYALLLTDRYPNSDPLDAVPDLPARADPIHVRVDDDLRRSRLTVFFRLPLAFPHLVWLVLWGIAALLAAIVSWVATLFTGRSPAWAHRFLCAYLRYQLHVYAFLHLIANPFPGFVGRAGSYPLELAVAERQRQNRWKTGFRLVLLIPALLLASAYGTLAATVALLGWFSSLARARMPRGMRNAGALALRYQAQTFGYALLLTDAYPYSGPVRAGVAEAGAGAGEGGGDEGPLASASPAPERPDTPGALPDVGLT
ncbi:MAG TPA: DUF4389 domain-containing protein [Solirubrobacteraceae bacterium]|nr:DUF4389 domain-containing protein [Solirubrobacteraceae bacterium]